jgi:hypothetical protein
MKLLNSGADAVRNERRCGFSTRIDRKNRGSIIRGKKKGTRRVRKVMLYKNDLRDLSSRKSIAKLST